MKTRTLAWVEATLLESGRLRHAELFDATAAQWRGATIDTRADCSQRIFFALSGEQTDGHRFTEEAVSRGSCAIVVESEDAAKGLARVDVPHFLVDNSLTALQELSRAYRDTLDACVIAVTGSSGKTTTKEYVRMILKSKYRVHANPGNYNNHIGVPLTLLETDADNEYLISEVGANHLGEIEFLAQLIRPNIGVITNIGDAHIGLFGSRDRIADAKSELLSGVDRDGHVVLPRDDDYFDLLKDRSRSRVVTYGFSEDSTYRAGHVEERGDHIEFRVNDEPLSIKSFGLYNVLNACAAFSVGELCGVEADRIRAALHNTEPVAGRAQIHRAANMIIIDDSYNANPSSMKASLDGLSRFPGRRHVAILGDMAELGTYAESAHREIGAYISDVAVDAVYWLGDNGRIAAEACRSAGASVTFETFDTFEELLRALRRGLKPGDAVLVKASRAAALDRVVERLLRGTVEEAG